MYGLPMSVCVEPVDRNERLNAPSICFVCVFACQEPLSPDLESLSSWITGVCVSTCPFL